MINHIPNGYGKLTCENTIYYGLFSNGKKHGSGVYIKKG